MAAGSAKHPIVVYAALAANFSIALTKFIVAALSGSSAMLSEGIHSAVDTGNQALLLLGIHRSRKPADERHPYGHGKEIFFWGLIVAVLLFGVGGGISFYEGVVHVMRPVPLTDPTWAFVVLGVAFPLELSAWTLALRGLFRSKGDASIWHALRASKDPALFTVLAEDTAAVVGLVVAFLGVLLSHLLGMPILDGVASIVIGVVLAGAATFLAYESKGLLVGESVEIDAARDIKRLVQSGAGVIWSGDPLTMHLGPDEVLLNVAVRFRSDLSGRQLADSLDRIERLIREAHPKITRIFIEAQPLAAAVAATSSTSSASTHAE